MTDPEGSVISLLSNERCWILCRGRRGWWALGPPSTVHIGSWVVVQRYRSPTPTGNHVDLRGDTPG